MNSLGSQLPLMNWGGYYLDLGPLKVLYATTLNLAINDVSTILKAKLYSFFLSWECVPCIEVSTLRTIIWMNRNPGAPLTVM